MESTNADSIPRPAVLLVGGDLHGNAAGASWFLERIVEHKPDLVIFLGDFVSGGPGSYIKEYIRDLRHVARAVFIVPGNWDPREAPALIDAECIDGARNLHKASAFHNGLIFAGLGGSITTPGGRSPLEYPDTTFAEPLEPLLPADVWVLHNPLHGYCDSIPGGEHVGSRSLLELYEAQKAPPRLVLSGHIHDDPGAVVAGPTTFLNPGPLSALKAALVKVAATKVDVTLLDGRNG
jgi:Icc-related predicted phosphoesterase